MTEATGMPDVYIGPDRRGQERRQVSRAEIADMVAEELDGLIADSQSNLILHIDSRIGQMMVAMKASTSEIVGAAVEAALKAHVEAAYPPGPLHKHKDHHQGLIDSAEMWKKIKADVASKSAWGIAGFIAYVLGKGALTMAQTWLEVSK